MTSSSAAPLLLLLLLLLLPLRPLHHAWATQVLCWAHPALSCLALQPAPPSRLLQHPHLPAGQLAHLSLVACHCCAARQPSPLPVVQPQHQSHAAWLRWRCWGGPPPWLAMQPLIHQLLLLPGCVRSEGR